VDFRDFIEINARLYGENPSHAAAIAYILRLLDALESRRADLGLPPEELHRR
jgi:hypothetical protein